MTDLRLPFAVLLLVVAGVFCFGFAARGAAGDEVVIHVSPTGQDNWSGRLSQPNSSQSDGPVASLAGARDAVRRVLAAEGAGTPVRVVVQDGTYAMHAPVEFLPADSGRPGAPISYEAAPGARPSFSGGRKISGFQSAPGGLWVAQLPEVASGAWYFDSLWVNERRATRARTADESFHYMAHVSEETLGGGSARQTIHVRPEDIALLDGLSEQEIRDVNLVAFHNWDITRKFLDSANPAAGTFTISGDRMKPWNPLTRETAFFLENVRPALDTPGEWFLSRSGSLYYHPLPGESISDARVVAPVAEGFLALRGNAAAGQFVEHISFRGLTFQHSQWNMPRGGIAGDQAAASIQADIMADGARHISFEGCEVSHNGRYGMWFRNGCSDIQVRKNYLHDLGAGGLRAGPGRVPQNPAERTSRVTFDNNIIHQGGRVLPCAVGIWIGQSGDNVVSHNEIADFFYTGISVGWRWGYNESLATNNRIEFNRIRHIGWAVLSDMGGIYHLGPGEGTVISNNLIHDIYSRSYGGWGLYTDEGTTGVTMENNIVYNTKSGGFHQHYGKQNVIQNNIFAFGMNQQLERTRAEAHLAFTFRHNIVYWKTGPNVLGGAWTDPQVRLEDNIYWPAAGQGATFVGMGFEAWQATGKDARSRIIDPRFVDADNYDFRFLPDSPVHELGFVAFDPDETGVYGDPDWVALADDIQFPALNWPPPPPELPSPPAVPPADIFEDFEDYGDLSDVIPVWKPLVLPYVAVSTLASFSDDWGVNLNLSSRGSHWERKFPGEVIPTDSNPVEFSFQFYDPRPTIWEGAATVVLPGNEFGEVGAVFEGQVAGGITSTVDVGEWDVNRYQARVAGVLPGDGWVQLAAARTRGWKTFKFVIRHSTVDVYVDGVLDPNGQGLPRPPGKPLDRVRLGGGMASNVGVHFDDISVTGLKGHRPHLTIAQQPAAQTSAVGGRTLELNIEADGTAPIFYQWYKNSARLENSSRISGATSSTLTIADFQASDAGAYHASIANGARYMETLATEVSLRDAPPATNGVFADFENYAPGTESVLFRSPRFSPTTSSLLEPEPDQVRVTSDFPPENPNSGARALQVNLRFFNTPHHQRWVRLTTEDAVHLANPVVNLNHTLTFDVYAEESVLVALGMRETDPTGEVGSDGGMAKPNGAPAGVEWIGPMRGDAQYPPVGFLVPAREWTTVTLDMRSGPVTAFDLTPPNNGKLESGTGKVVLDHLAIIPTDSTAQDYTIYLDNFALSATDGGGETTPSELPVLSVAPSEEGGEPGISILLVGEPGKIYPVERSDDLVDWIFHREVQAGEEGFVLFREDIPEGVSRRFYRVRLSAQ